MGKSLKDAVTRLSRVSLALALLTTFFHAAVATAQDGTTVVMQQNPTYGTILTDPNGFTLYTWEGDEEGVSNCSGSCAAAWPPFTVDGDLVPPDGLPMSLGLIERDDGTWQVTVDNWPLYHFVRD